MWVVFYGQHKRLFLLMNLLLLMAMLQVTTILAGRVLLPHQSLQGKVSCNLSSLYFSSIKSLSSFSNPAKHTDQQLHHLESSKERLGVKRGGGGVDVHGNGLEGLMTALGSRPPSCEHKCGGCVPCVAIQVPTTTDRFGVQYANYEPEGWKCKCGSTFFNP